MSVTLVRLRQALRARAHDVADAWAVGSVRRGLVGTLLIAIGATSPAYLPRNSPWWRLLEWLHATGMIWRTLGTVITMLGLLLLLDAWFRLRPRHPRTASLRATDGHSPKAYHDLKHWAILGIWGAPFLFAPPIFSHDAYSYAAQGWLIHNGINPYEAGPGVLPGAFADQVSWVWRNTPAPYGPLSLQIQHLLVDATGFDPYWAAVVQRFPALLGVIIIGLLVPRIARRCGADPSFAAWFATLNPILVIDFIGGSHNDSLMMGLVILGVWIAGWPASTRRFHLGRWGFCFGNNWWLLGAVVIGCGAAIKQPAFLAAYALPIIARHWNDWTWRDFAITAGRVAASFLLAIGTFALISVATGLGFGWVNAVNVPGMVITIAPFTLLGQAFQLVINIFGIDPTGRAAIRYSRGVGMVVAGLGVSYLALTVARKRPHTFLAQAYLFVAFCAPALRSWYVLWGGLMLPWSQPRGRVVRAAQWATVVVLCYDGVNMAWRNGLIALGVALAAGIWWLARTNFRNQWLVEGGGDRRRRIPAVASHIELLAD